MSLSVPSFFCVDHAVVRTKVVEVSEVSLY